LPPELKISDVTNVSGNLKAVRRGNNDKQHRPAKL
jgi:hypothetical protein